jgi:hypothetical protein
MSIRKGCFGTLFLLVVYAAGIPVFFDLPRDRALLLSAKQFESETTYLRKNFDTQIHDGPAFQNSLLTLGDRIHCAEQEMLSRNRTSRFSFVPRWYQPERDFYLNIQRRSFVHSLYPFLATTEQRSPP